MVRVRLVPALLLALVLAVAVAACGGDDGNGGGGESEGSGSEVRVALVTDIGGLNDRGFNALANQGLERAERELGFRPQTRIEEGLPLLVDWCRRYYGERA